MMTEWMKVMLDEIARKQAEAEAARVEAERRQRDASPSTARPSDDPAQG